MGVHSNAINGSASSKSHFRLAGAAIGNAKDTGNLDFWGDGSCEDELATLLK